MNSKFKKIFSIISKLLDYIAFGFLTIINLYFLFAIIILSFELDQKYVIVSSIILSIVLSIFITRTLVRKNVGMAGRIILFFTAVIFLIIAKWLNWGSLNKKINEHFFARLVCQHNIVALGSVVATRDKRVILRADDVFEGTVDQTIIIAAWPKDMTHDDFVLNHSSLLFLNKAEGQLEWRIEGLCNISNDLQIYRCQIGYEKIEEIIGKKLTPKDFFREKKKKCAN